MTYGRVHTSVQVHKPHGRGRKSLAELVRGEFLPWEGPLIRPFGPPSPQRGEGPSAARFAIPLRLPRMRQIQFKAIHLMLRES